jgi:hypothetical protein
MCKHINRLLVAVACLYLFRWSLRKSVGRFGLVAEVWFCPVGFVCVLVSQSQGRSDDGLAGQSVGRSVMLVGQFVGRIVGCSLVWSVGRLELVRPIWRV